jgi:hypothetical protein
MHVGIIHSLTDLVICSPSVDAIAVTYKVHRHTEGPEPDITSRFQIRHRTDLRRGHLVSLCSPHLPFPNLAIRACLCGASYKRSQSSLCYVRSRPCGSFKGQETSSCKNITTSSLHALESVAYQLIHSYILILRLVPYLDTSLPHIK